MKTILSMRIIGILAILWMAGQNTAIAQCTASAAGGTNISASDGVYLGQHFTASCSGELTQATVDFATAQPYGVTATIRSTCQGTILGTAVSAGTVTAGTNTFTFANIPVTATNTYVLEIARTGGGNVGGMRYSTSNPYTGGDLYDAISPCRLFPTFDFNFSVTITDPCATFSASATNTPILCHGGTSVVTVTATGGTPPYSGTGPQAPRPAGPYSYTVTDAKNCSYTVSGTISEPTAVVATVSPALTCLTTGYGPTSVTLVASGTGGTGTISNTTLTVSPTTTSTVCVTNTYTLTVMDANGCSASATGIVRVRDVRCYSNGNGNAPSKVNVCHGTGNGGSMTLCIGVSGVASHLAHGDGLGACGSMTCCATGYARMTANGVPAISDFKVYPNPTNRVINLDIPYSEDEAQVLITDVTGRIVINRTVDAGLNAPVAIDIEQMPKGVYLVKVIVAGTVYTEKFSKY